MKDGGERERDLFSSRVVCVVVCVLWHHMVGCGVVVLVFCFVAVCGGRQKRRRGYFKKSALQRSSSYNMYNIQILLPNGTLKPPELLTR